MEQYYDILGIDNNSNNQTITQAYRKLAKIYHPDKNKENTTEQFNKIKDAYDKLLEYNNKKNSIANRNNFNININCNQNMTRTQTNITIVNGIKKIHKTVFITRNGVTEKIETIIEDNMNK